MAWNDQMSSVPGDGGRSDVDHASVAPPPIGVGPVSASGLQGQGTLAPQGLQNPLNPTAGGQVQPVQPAMPPLPPQMPPAAARPNARGRGRPPMRPQQPPVDSRDDVWIERAKRAIAETQNDPFRQVQLLQHLNRLYLKDRFNRVVHADDHSDMYPTAPKPAASADDDANSQDGGA